TVIVSVHPDTLVEDTETFTLSVTGDNITGTLQATGTIFDDDAADDGMGGGDDGHDMGGGDGGMGGGSGGSDPFVGGGQTYTVGTTSVVTGFDPTRDVLDLGPNSIHNQIPVDTPDGFMMLHMFNASQSLLVEGVNLADLHPENFAPISDSHLQQDLSAVLAYEDGSGLVRPNTVYVRSHQQGLVETVDFDPATDKVSFFYLSVRGDGQRNFAVEDTADGARFYNPLTGQSLTLRGVSFSELNSDHFEWRANQLEDGIAGRMGLESVIDNFSYPSDNIFTGKSVAMAGGVDRAPYHSVQGYEDYTGTPISEATGGGTGGDAPDPGVVGTDADDIILADGAANTMTGGLGDDVYYVDDANDLVVEAAGEGWDLVYASVSYALGDHVELAILEGSESHDLTAGATGTWLNGNSGANALTGGAGRDRIDGNAGDDIIAGGGDNDILEGGTGNDIFVIEDNAGVDLILDFEDGADLIDFTALNVPFNSVDIQEHSLGTAVTHSQGLLILVGNAVENLTADDFLLAVGAAAPTITGTENADTIFESQGPLMLEGLGGSDRLRVLEGDATLVGGTGDDRYYVYDGATEIVEQAGEGFEWVYAYTDFALPENVEGLRATGADNLALMGSIDSNWIIGNAGANTITGGEGNDRLSGADGADTFVFATGDGIDTIMDFTIGSDLIDLSATGLAYSDLEIAQSGSAAHLSFGTDLVVLASTTASDVTEAQFILA
ncbi:MAG: calcium-binding protein, partial [Pseudomonadota bacterium]